MAVRAGGTRGRGKKRSLAIEKEAGKGVCGGVPDKNNFKEKEFLLAEQFQRVSAHMVREAWKQGGTTWKQKQEGG